VHEIATIAQLWRTARARSARRQITAVKFCFSHAPRDEKL
jgi:hypothetical protein